MSLIRKNIESDQRRSPVEKVYLHFDRTFYMSGESIHFGAFAVEGPQHIPTTISNNVHVELLSPSLGLVSRITIQVTEGCGSGHFDLPDSLATGVYTIRAYTNWMLNFDHAYVFQKAIRVYSLFANQQVSAAPLDEATPGELQFLPEGGNWVYGIGTRVGFKALNRAGLGVAVRGKIFDDLGREVATFQSKHLGMGMIYLVPDYGRTYYARVEGLDRSFQLPTPAQTGLVLGVVAGNPDNNIRFRIQTPQVKVDNHVTIIVQCRGKVIYSQTATIASGELNGSLPRAAFLPGINQITVFNKDQQPVAERAFYVDQPTGLNIKTELSDTIVGKRKKVVMTMNVKDQQGKPVVARFSVSATDNSQVVLSKNREVIDGYLLLRSDLKGTIEDPGYYFNTANPDRFEALDLLLMTQGWRTFSWERIRNDVPMKISHLSERGFRISGTMKQNYSTKPISYGKVSFLSKDFKTIFGAIETNAAGRFRVDDIQVDGPTEILFQGHFKKEKRTDVWFDFDTLQVRANPDFNVMPWPEEIGEFEHSFINKGILRRNVDDQFNVEKDVTLLESVVIRGQKIPTTIREKLVADGRGYKRTIIVDNTSWATHPFQLLRGKATGIGDCVGRPIRIYWDGMEIFHFSQLNAKDPNMVSEIDTACDLIAFWTRRGSFTNSAKSFMLRGYQPKREYYAPKYHQQLPDHSKEDYRVTLDFQPEVHTNALGLATFEFYTSDLSTTITISAEGLTRTGIPFAVQRTVRVTP